MLLSRPSRGQKYKTACIEMSILLNLTRRTPGATHLRPGPEDEWEGGEKRRLQIFNLSHTQLISPSPVKDFKNLTPNFREAKRIKWLEH